MFDIQNRRYIGNKTKLMDWINEIIIKNCKGSSFFDVFAGTGSVSNYLLQNNNLDTFYINDFLYSNEVIYNAFFEQAEYDMKKLENIKDNYNKKNVKKLKDNYVSNNFGNKYFNKSDAKLIGFIREDIEKSFKNKIINEKEKNILIASLLYSMDKIANTCGHYDSYRKTKNIESSFSFDIIKPLDLENKKIFIYREDANIIAKSIKSDIVFIDPPYNSRQYSRFYHVLETITKWDKPNLEGVAMKPKEENMSDYCKVSASKKLKDLINSLNCSYIVLTYNNTYNPKSNSSKNKITLEEIEEILEKKGTVIKFEKDYKAFNTGKTELDKHKEFVFVVKVNKG
jgi:adenine-specific DNA-methyltransferase